MQSEIQQELNRVIGGPGATASEFDNRDPANSNIKLETTHAIYRLPAKRLLALLRELPDEIGVNPLRQSIEHHFESTN